MIQCIFKENCRNSSLIHLQPKLFFLRMNRIFFVLLALVLWSQVSISQQANPPFWNDIQAFKKQDSAQQPSTGAILFIGSSSFTNWRDVQTYFPDRTIINRGFGGSSLPHLILYADDLIDPYQPRQIVIYCGENDLAASDTVSAQTVVSRFQQLFGIIRAKQPKVPVVFISIKPSPSRQHLMPKMVEANEAIKKFLKKQRNTQYVDVYHLMLMPGGQPREELFVGDRLHMNAQGYAIWQKALQPVLKK